ncbi:hypothetical protein SAMN06295905_2802 [Devosia lucknowensis]|uniref:Glycosyl hydrolases family 43 n=1 Tax=Devosia lucknowensis TaxID=1096929 RepID=A0A1Y6G860_9HYPH|nr:hypothetical protein [Devosia lucknowensis]SMQ85523.1 hypothetical protein SAMN06295905_2802 [Devosia lucknowensis]
MAIRWTRLGQIYDAPPLHEKLQTHAANPLPVHLYDDVFRVFFSGRDVEKRSSVGYVDIDIVTRAVLETCREPVFRHGPSQSFYSHGVSIGNCYTAGGQRYILFMGWHIPKNEHWRGEIGRFVLGKDLSLTLNGDMPFFGLSESDPISLSYPWVMDDARGGHHMWYGSTLSWDAGNGEMLHIIRHAHSLDGHAFQPDRSVIPYALGKAQAFSRPTVVQNGDGWSMWYSCRSGRGETYRIGHATSPDGCEWHHAEPGFDVAAEGWDSEMIEYPFVFRHKGKLFMLYNGNGYGQTGFGLAVASD